MGSGGRRLGCVALAAMLVATVAGAEESTIGSDFFEVRIGPGANAEDNARCQALLRIMDRLREDLDRSLIDAKVLKAAAAAKKPRKPWKVYWFKTTAESRTFLKGLGSGMDAAPNVYYWAGPEFPEPCLTFVPTEDRTRNMRKLLEHGTSLVVSARLGISMCLRSEDRGVPLLYGLAQYMHHSVFPAVLDYPRRLGGCPTDAIERMQKKIEEGTFPTLEFLFTAPKHSYTGNMDELHFPSVLLVEFLLEGEGMDPANFWSLMETYRNRSFGTDGKKAYDTFLKKYAKSLGGERAISERFQAHIRLTSPALNKAKWDSRSEVVAK